MVEWDMDTDKMADLNAVRTCFLAVRLALNQPLEHADLVALADKALLAIDIVIDARIADALRASTRRPLSLRDASEGYGGLLDLLDNETLH